MALSVCFVEAARVVYEKLSDNRLDNRLGRPSAKVPEHVKAAGKWQREVLIWKRFAQFEMSD